MTVSEFFWYRYQYLLLVPNFSGTSTYYWYLIFLVPVPVLIIGTTFFWYQYLLLVPNFSGTSTYYWYQIFLVPVPVLIFGNTPKNGKFLGPRCHTLMTIIIMLAHGAAPTLSVCVSRWSAATDAEAVSCQRGLSKLSDGHDYWLADYPPLPVLSWLSTTVLSLALC